MGMAGSSLLLMVGVIIYAIGEGIELYQSIRTQF